MNVVANVANIDTGQLHQFVFHCPTISFRFRGFQTSKSVREYLQTKISTIPNDDNLKIMLFFHMYSSSFNQKRNRTVAFRIIRDWYGR